MAQKVETKPITLVIRHRDNDKGEAKETHINFTFIEGKGFNEITETTCHNWGGVHEKTNLSQIFEQIIEECPYLTPIPAMGRFINKASKHLGQVISYNAVLIPEHPSLIRPSA